MSEKDRAKNKEGDTIADPGLRPKSPREPRKPKNVRPQRPSPNERRFKKWKKKIKDIRDLPVQRLKNGGSAAQHYLQHGYGPHKSSHKVKSAGQALRGWGKVIK